MLARFVCGRLCLWTLALLIAHSAATCSTSSDSTPQYSETVLHDFTQNYNGEYPFTSLIWGPSGNLYGESNGNGSYPGNAFELDLADNGFWNYKEIYQFAFTGEGVYPSGPLSTDEVGNLYGTTLVGGPNNTGSVYELNEVEGAWYISYLYNFGPMLGGDAVNPNGVQFFRGGLFGTSPFGGKYGSGTVFALLPESNGGWSEHILYNFSASGIDGQHPTGGLVFDSKGNMYGTTLLGGTHSGGVIFELSGQADGNWHEKILHNFAERGGYFPGSGTLVFDSKGDLYGTTNSGGAADYGVVFELSPSDGKWIEIVLHDFLGGEDGASPGAGVTFDSQGRLLGTTEAGGGQGFCWNEEEQNIFCGTVYALTPSENGSWTESILHSFTDGDDGGVPSAGVVLDTHDNVYGVTGQGGDGLGVVFELSPVAGP